MARPPKLEPDDYARLRAEFVAGLKPLPELAAKYKLSVSGVRNMAKRDNWGRNLDNLIRGESKSRDARLEAAEHIEKVRKEKVDPWSLKTADIVDAIAALQSEIRTAHKARLQREHRIADGLLQRFEQQASEIDLPEAIRIFKILIEANDKIIMAERRAYDLDQPDGKEGTLEDHLDALASNG